MISINIYEIVMQMVNFVILVWLINRFLVKPVGEFLNNRAQGIKDDIEQASKNKTETESLVSEQKELLKNARLEAQQIRQKTEEAVQKEREQLISAAKEESANIVGQAKKEIQSDVSKAKKDLLNQIGDLTVLLSERILKRTLSDSDKQRLVAENLENLKQS